MPSSRILCLGYTFSAGLRGSAFWLSPGLEELQHEADCSVSDAPMPCSIDGDMCWGMNKLDDSSPAGQQMIAVSTNLNTQVNEYMRS